MESLPTDEDRFYRDVGNRIEMHQQRCAMSDDLLGAMAGFDGRQLRAYKSGERTLSAYRLQRLAIALEIPASRLLEAAQ